MMAHPTVEDVAVIGRPHEIDGEHPVACVVLKENEKATAEELIQFINGNSEISAQLHSFKKIALFRCESVFFYFYR